MDSTAPRSRFHGAASALLRMRSAVAGIALPVALAGSWLACDAHAAPDPSCAAWPGEIAPLPATDSADAFNARWARMRAAELSQVAGALARSDPAGAYRLWQHALCLDPANASVTQRLAQLVPRTDVLQEPAIARVKPPAAEPASTPVAGAAPAPAPPTDFTMLDRRLKAAEAALAEARFEDVLESVRRVRSTLATMTATSPVRERRARLEVLASTAQLALGQEAEAIASLRRALKANPNLTLDDETPPKVRNLLTSVREGTGPEGAEVSSQ